MKSVAVAGSLVNAKILEFEYARVLYEGLLVSVLMCGSKTVV